MSFYNILDTGKLVVIREKLKGPIKGQSLYFESDIASRFDVIWFCNSNQCFCLITFYVLRVEYISDILVMAT